VVFFSTLFISLLLTVVTIPLLTRMALRFNLLDVPDERKSHKVPIPRCGGLAMAFGALTPMAYWYAGDPFIVSFLAAASCIVFFGIADDFFGLSPRWKFLGQILAALIVIVFGGVKIVSLGALLPDGVLLPLGLSVPLTLLTLVGVTNAVNLSDGLDGLAGGMSLLNVCFIGYLAVISGNTTIALASLAMTGAIFGFLRFNTHPASIFMGDSGSQLLGFSAVTFSLAVTQQAAAISPLAPLLLFGLPILDTLTVMITRIVNGLSPFSPDRRHFHHRLLRIGLGHAEAVLALYLLQAILVLMAFFLRFQSGWLILSFYLLFSASILYFFYYASKVGWQQIRWQPLDRAKSWFKAVRGPRRILAVAFPGFRYLFYVLILACSFLPQKCEPLPALALLAPAGAILLACFFRPEALGRLIRIVFFLLIPIAVYRGDCQALSLLGCGGDKLVNGIFVLLFILSILVSFFSTRQKGIWSTPLDFLILLLMIILPNLAGIGYHNQRLGLVGLKCIILIISFEVLIAEMRGNNKGVATAMALGMCVYVLRSVV